MIDGQPAPAILALNPLPWGRPDGTHWHFCDLLKSIENPTKICPLPQLVGTDRVVKEDSISTLAVSKRWQRLPMGLSPRPFALLDSRFDASVAYSCAFPPCTSQSPI